MRTLRQLFENNRQWARRIQKESPEFFERLQAVHDPGYLWIGCSDARVPANEIIGLPAGEVFVHRNVANQVIHTDINCLSVIQYAVDVLRVPHIIVCGHYDCGGVKGACRAESHGLIDNWLRHVRDVIAKHRAALDEIDDPGRRQDRVCELNVIEQVHNVCRTTIVQEAWSRGQELAVHGWIYRLSDGLLQDLDVCITQPEEISEVYRLACQTERK
ncbi:MAG: carbonate dehydratase [Phycisphaerae bacterium]|nr:carbonate dehydratase [Phycisphaerae bacterium]